MNTGHRMFVCGAVKDFESYNKDFANEPHNDTEP